MNIYTYVNEMEEAAVKVFEALNADTEEIIGLRKTQSFHQHEAEEWIKSSMTIGGPFGDYADPQREWFTAMRHYDKIEALEKEVGEQIMARAMSLSALSGTILQFGKQGLSLVYGAKAKVPAGRMVGSQPLKEIIWEARNHYMHWEEENPKPACVACMDKLNVEFQDRVHDYRTANVSAEVLEILGWDNFDSFADDLRTFDGP